MNQVARHALKICLARQVPLLRAPTCDGFYLCNYLGNKFKSVWGPNKNNSNVGIAPCLGALCGLF